MPAKNNQNYPVSFSTDIYNAFIGLGMRGLMTPSYLSTLVMYAVLPAKLNVVVEKNDSDLTDRYFFNKRTHTFNKLSVAGIDSLEVLQKHPGLKQEYEIFCCANAQDAMSEDTICSRISVQPNKNYIFWNYPGVGRSAGDSHSTQDLFKAGYKQAKRLLDQGVLAKDITLRGLSLGGGVAVHVARQLHEEGELVNLEVDRSFARISAVIPASMKKIGAGGPLSTSIIALGLSGVALGTTLSGFLASVGLVTASSTIAVGYIGACFTQCIGLVLQKIMRAIGEMIAFPFSFFSKATSNNIKSCFNGVGEYLAWPFNLTAFAINKTISILASFIDRVINLLGSIAGGLSALSGLVVGSLSGLVFGMLLSLQLLWTDKPLTMPLTPVFSAALNSACCEMDSVDEMYRLLAADNKPENREKEQAKISVINTLNDEIIDVAASLNTGLGFEPGGIPRDDENKQLKQKVSSFWYRDGGHMGEVSKPVHPHDDARIDEQDGVVLNPLFK